MSAGKEDHFFMVQRFLQIRLYLLRAPMKNIPLLGLT